jgi:hypothetical protein
MGPGAEFMVSAKLVRRATTQPLCEVLRAALRRHGIPDQILTDSQAWGCPEDPWIVRPAV